MGLKATIGLLGVFGIVSLAGVVDSSAQTRIQRQFDKWLVACVEPEGNDNRCTLTQTFQGVNQKTKSRVFVFSWALIVNNEGQENVILRTPLGVDLNKSVKIGFPDSEAVTVTFDVCNRRGCFGEFRFENGWSEAMQRNEKVSIDYVFKNGRDVNLEMELKGFGGAYAFYKQQMSQ
ncbi:MAG: hypothetical protein GY789_06005 [Hyphomicrobiales bacterium]|nr:hypothetical protein [Hyphomicrobiales bacterium]